MCFVKKRIISELLDSLIKMEGGGGRMRTRLFSCYGIRDDSTAFRVQQRRWIQRCTASISATLISLILQVRAT